MRLPIKSIFLSVLTFFAVSVDAQTKIRIVAANTSSGNFQSYPVPGPGQRIFQGLDADIALIQEFNVDGATVDQFVDQTFGTEFQYYVESGAQIPNGIVSRYPILSSGEWNDPEVSNRDFAWARIDIPGDKHLWAISVHLLTANASTRNAEAQALKTYIQNNVPAGDYIVIGGDFNTGSFSESCFSTLSTYVTNAKRAADQNGNQNTNANRNNPYDQILPDHTLNGLAVPVLIGNNSFTNGFIADTRVYNPISDLSPALANDSGASQMQHMAVVKDFLIPDGNGGTPTPTPNPTPTGTGATPTPTGVPSGGDVFINEIHYDNENADANEGVEVAGPAGDSLSGWSLAAYNGSGGTVYDTVSLSGTFTDQNGCMGTIWFAFEQVQNGAPDAIALVNASNQVVQFLSYEGTMMANDGPAVGMTSTDIGVEETNSTTTGFSLQLQGTGNKYSDFTWSPNAIAHTRGNVNTGQTFNNCVVETPTPSPSASPVAGNDGWVIE